jgi:hypothetical protein
MMRQGFVLVMAIWVAFLVLITGLSLVFMAQSNLDIAANLRASAEVMAMAQGGLDHGLLLVRSEGENTPSSQEVSYHQGLYRYTVSIKRLRRPEDRRTEYQVKSIASGPRKSSYTAYQVLARMSGPPDQAEGLMAQGALSLEGNLTLTGFIGGNAALHSNTQLSTAKALFETTVAPLLSISSEATAVGPYTLNSTPPITLRNGLRVEDPKAQITLSLALYAPRNCLRVPVNSGSLSLYSQTDLDRLWTERGLSFGSCIEVAADVHIQSAGSLDLNNRKLMVRSLSSDTGSTLNLSNTTLHASDTLNFKRANLHNSSLLSRNRLDFDATCLNACNFSGTNVLLSETAAISLHGMVTPPGPGRVGLYVYGGKQVYIKTSGAVHGLVRSGVGGVVLGQATDFTGGIISAGGIQVKGDLTLRKPQGFVIPGNPSPAPTLLQGPVEVLSRR